ncbi:Hypothetical Protein FCC1311_057012 [Hondaea fermentalgiana]|uniref:TFIIS N-terminal domain-containing protein n=1 Tax=Hondaea fermentalgiana TaxID=2315210 RepID=A0A2R5GEY4_9STRA|nr:Hypothetical Protein FCC1311_057012 [Hondaea fermentalgiana]|eukprot:GBG29480.1 Hypothetical Protein FCC1311_057012 [Hondaea fermentalgiana]
MSNALSSNSSGKRRAISSSKFRQGTLMDCKKVVVLQDVEYLRNETSVQFKACLRAHAQFPTESTKDVDNSKKGSETPATGKGREGSSATPVVERNEALTLAQSSLQSALQQLESMFIALETLRETGVGKTVNKVAQASEAVVGSKAKDLSTRLVERWRKTAKDALVRSAERDRRGPIVMKRV